MIESKKDYYEFLKCDKTALGRNHLKRPRFMHDVIWSYQILLRKCEYYNNCRHDFIGKIICKLLKMRFVHLNHKLGFSIPLNVFDKGLSIAHYGTIVVNANAVVGENCRIHEGVTIGVTGDDYKDGKTGSAAIIGDRVFLASGVKVIGRVQIANDVAIGANSVVVHDILEANTTWAGIPAKKISSKGSSQYILRGVEDESGI